MQIVSRGGTSEYHGSGYYYGRHERFNSTEFFRARSQRLKASTRSRRNTGSTPGARTSAARSSRGRSKLFFFYSAEAPIVKRPQSVQTWRMPSALEREGDFSQTFDAQGRLINIRDPRDRPRVQRRDRRAGLLPGKHHPE